MSKFCSYCGTEVFESANNCPNCGASIDKNIVNNNSNYNYYNNQSGYNHNGYNQNGYNQVNNNFQNPYGNFNNSVTNNKVPGKGLSITGMVLGIIAVFWTICELCSLGNIDYSLNTLNYISDSTYVVSFAIGYTLFAFIPSILGLIFSIVGLKKQKSGFNISGIILNAIALSITFIIFVYIVTAF